MVKTFEELWPLPAPEVVVVTGPFGCGKSTFALSTGADPKRIKSFDFEKSQKGFSEQLPIDYVDVQSELSKKFPTGYKPLDLFNWTVSTLDAAPDGAFDVLILDNASPFEDGILAYVEKNPQEFGHSAGQYSSMSGLKWGDVKTKYTQVLTRWVSKFKMIFIIVHLRDKWVGSSVLKDAMGKVVQEPKGKETLEMLSSLFVWLEHGPGGVPSAKVLKCRIDRKTWVADPENPPLDIPEEYLKELNGEPGLVTMPVLPLRLPKATWPAIREYMRNPADLRNPRPGERPTDQQLSEDDRLKIRSIISQNEAVVADTEKVKIEAGLEKTKANLLKYAGQFGLNAETVGTVLKDNGFLPWNPDNWERMRDAVRTYDANSREEKEAEVETETRDLPALQKFAASQGVEKEKLGAFLKTAGFTAFNAGKWDEMKAAIILYASEHNLKQEGIEQTEAV